MYRASDGPLWQRVRCLSRQALNWSSDVEFTVWSGRAFQSFTILLLKKLNLWWQLLCFSLIIWPRRSVRGGAIVGGISHSIISSFFFSILYILIKSPPIISQLFTNMLSPEGLPISNSGVNLQLSFSGIKIRVTTNSYWLLFLGLCFSALQSGFSTFIKVDKNSMIKTPTKI